MTFEDAVEDWKSNDEWKLADRDTCWRFMFSKGKEDAMKIIERQAAQIEMMRGALEEVKSLISESSGVYGLHLNGDPSPWDELEQRGEFERLTLLYKALSSTPDQALEQFAAIADLSGVIMCEKKPVAYMAVYKDQVMGFIPTQESGTIPVYRAIKELP